MLFHTPLFLFLFLPVCLLVYFLADRRYRNLAALAGSLVFFAWGNLGYVPLLLALTLISFWQARALQRLRAQPARARRVLWSGIALPVLLLIFFKAISVYDVGWLPFLPAAWGTSLMQNPLPLGFSYITFQIIAYLVDVDSEISDPEPSFLTYALYIFLFPKIVVGPIVRYRDVAEQLSSRVVTAEEVAAGVRRFILGLAKKILIADTLARVVNPAFGLSSPNFSTPLAWLVIVAYAVQLYFDFSGYTDMAIGLGQMLGFRFLENFRYPYIANSISDFWRRWHISLSSWFRDYVFYPLERTRRKPSLARQQLHILLVFLLTGLWHGLTINFALWGLLHGLALALEMTVFGKWLKRAWPPLRHIYTLLVILAGWVFFRSSSPVYAAKMLLRLAGSHRGISTLPFSLTQPLPIIEPSVWLALGLGIIFSLPVLPAIRAALERSAFGQKSTARAWVDGLSRLSADVALLALLVITVAASVGSAYTASIYGGF